MKYLLDTNACIDFIRNAGRIRQRMKAHAFSDFSISSVVVAELMYGAKRSPQPEQNLSATQNFCEKLHLIPFDGAAAEAFADMRIQLERDGLRIGAYDMLIAAHAMSKELTCITNDSGFHRVRGLRVEDWRE